MSDVEIASDSAAPTRERLPRPDLSPLEDVPDAIAVHDAEGTLVFVNDRAAELCGFDSPESMVAAKREEWMGRFELYDADGALLPLSELPGRRVLAGLDSPKRLACFRQNGRERWSSLAARRLRGSDPPLVINVFRETSDVTPVERRLRDELLLSRALQKGSLALASELDHDKLVQRITDEATAICGAQFGAFFHNVERPEGGSYLLYTISGVARSAFERFEQPRATEVFAPTFRGEGVVRSPDITKDPRYGKMAPHHGMPKGHLPVVSYLAVPVVSGGGEVLGGLFFGHPEPDRFSEAHERAVEGIAMHAAVALEKAALLRRLRDKKEHLAAERSRIAELLDQQTRARDEIEKARGALERSERRFRSLVEASSQMVWSTTPSGEVLEDSPSWRAFTGQSYLEWIGTGWLDAVHPEDRERASKAWRTAVEQGRNYEVEYRVRRADGSYAHTLVRGTPVRSEGGEVREWIGLNLDISERVRTEEALRESERTLRLALDAGQMGTWEYDIPGGRVHWSPQIEQMHGIPVGTFDGTFESYQQDIHPDDRDWVLQAIARNLQQGTEHKLLYRIVRPDGAVRWLEAFGTFVRDTTGAPAKLIGVCSDVTERIEAQENKHALRIRRILEGISDSFSVYDQQWTVIFANDAGTAPLGMTPGQVIGKNLWELLPATLGTKFHSELIRVLESGEPSTFEEYYAPLDQWFEVHVYPVADVGIATYSRNVTARRREQAYHERVVRYGELRVEIAAALSNTSGIRTILTECTGAIAVKLAAARAEIWLMESEGDRLELVASSGRKAADAGSAVALTSGLLGAIAEHRQATLLNDLAPEVRAESDLSAFAGAPLVVDGRLLGAVCVHASSLPNDTIVALGGAADAIAQGLERRRAELSLEERARDLARSNEDLQQFAYVASHDLQEPLRMVASYVQLLERRYRDKLDDDARDFIGYAVEGVTRMRRLIEDLLAYSRVGTRGKEPGDVSLERALSLAEKNLQGAISEAGASIEHGELPELVGDEAQLAQLFQNLIGNAIKFRREQPPHIQISARAQGDEWVIAVSDNGIGIEPQYFDRIFAIFQRLNPREQYPGTGIGLAIVKKIVERHGGRIWVESSPGVGSTISFTMPAGRSRRSLHE